jgi:acetylornithine deacetylase/succinyl-diaminopimelate desuccinylase-like protein
VADSGNWSETVPALTVSLRGNVTFKLTVRTLDHALHSGMFGGAIPDAMLAMIRLLGSLHNEDGSVAVEGLSASAPATPDYDEARLREESGLLANVTPLGSGTFLNRIWNQPSITVTGIDAPNVNNASNTLLPEVSVRVSVRVAPGQTASAAADAVTSHLLAHAPWPETFAAAARDRDARECPSCGAMQHGSAAAPVLACACGTVFCFAPGGAHAGGTCAEYEARVADEEGKTEVELAVAGVGKVDSKKHLDADCTALFGANIVQALGTALNSEIF